MAAQVELSHQRRRVLHLPETGVVRLVHWLALVLLFAAVVGGIAGGASLNQLTAPADAVAPAGASYIFNASGQSMDLSGLLCLFDADGPCANPVKDAQRTKTGPETRRDREEAMIQGRLKTPCSGRSCFPRARSEVTVLRG